MAAATPLATGSSSGIFSIAFRDTGHGIVVVGPQGADLSTDDGRSWTSLAGATGLHTFAVARGGRAGWGAGESGRIFRLAY